MTFVEDAKLREALRKPFDPKQIGKLPRKTKTGSVIYLDYVGHAAVVDRLNTVAPDWALTLDRVVEADGHVLAAVGTMTIGGKPMTEVGEPTGQNTYGQELQTALGNLIRRAAMRFGLGIDLWSKEELHGSEDSAASVTAPGEKTDGAVSGIPTSTAADEPEGRASGSGDTGPAPGSTISASEVSDGASAHNASASDGRDHATPEQWDRLLAIVGSETKVLPIAAKVLGRSMSKTALASLTSADMAKVIEGAMA
jgi:hypothetical protein